MLDSDKIENESSLFKTFVAAEWFCSRFRGVISEHWHLNWDLNENRSWPCMLRGEAFWMGQTASVCTQGGCGLTAIGEQKEATVIQGLHCGGRWADPQQWTGVRPNGICRLQEGVWLLLKVRPWDGFRQGSAISSKEVRRGGPWHKVEAWALNMHVVNSPTKMGEAEKKGGKWKYL